MLLGPEKSKFRSFQSPLGIKKKKERRGASEKNDSVLRRKIKKHTSEN